MTIENGEGPEPANSAERAARGPLAGLRVLDLSSVIMGPFATQTLGDFGAEILLVEPLRGGTNRSMDRDDGHPGLTGTALNLLRNKRSIAADLKDAEVRHAILRLARSCDVVLSNLRPRSLDRLGLAYGDFVAQRPDIIFCVSTGFRSDGPRANDPAYDDIIQAECGIADAAARSGRPPSLAPTVIADKVCGLTIANAILAALVHRERTGQGQAIEVPMLEVMKAFVLVEHGGDALLDPEAVPGYSRVLNPLRGPQRTRDGWINILPYSPADFDAIFEAGGMAELVGGPLSSNLARIAANAAALYGKLHEVAVTRTTREWLDYCAERNVPVGRVTTLEELVAELPVAAHPVVGEYRLIPPPVRFSASPASVARPAQELGQDTAAILSEAGLSPAEVNSLIARGAVSANSPARADVPTETA